MATLDKQIAGTISWADVQTPDLQKAQTFYGGLLDWSFVGSDDAQAAFYVMGLLNQRRVAGIARLGAQSAFPPMWSIYFAVDDADDTARKVREHGGELVVPPMDVMEEGRMAYFTDPAGAYFGVWQGRRHQGAQVIDEPGTMVWHEVYTRDVTRARQFYATVFGLTEKRLDAPGLEYWTLHQGARTVCGVMQMTANMPADEPPHWNTYFAVTDPDAAGELVTRLGGRVLAPAFDTPYGRITFVADPFGATFCLIRPSALMHAP